MIMIMIIMIMIIMIMIMMILMKKILMIVTFYNDTNDRSIFCSNA